MRVLLLLVLTATQALAYGHHGMKKGGCGYDDGYHGHHENECGRGHGRHESDAGHGYGGYGKKYQRHHDDDDHHDDHHDDHDERVYKFQIGEDFGAYEYLDEQGHLQGFFVDLLKAVCKKAGKKCAYLLDSYEHCWRTVGEKEYPGVGLMDGWYDACLGMMPNPDRLNTFDFTMAFTPNVKAALHWRAKEDMGDKHNLTNRRIGFIEGWAVSQRCVKRQYKLSEENSYHPVMFKTHKEMVTALLDKKVDAIISVNVFESAKLGIVPGDTWFKCTERGLSVMAHYYSDVISWWNCAFTNLKRSGEFSELCHESQEKHAHRGEIKCI